MSIMQRAIPKTERTVLTGRRKELLNPNPARDKRS
jgi:hypothetical protein